MKNKYILIGAGNTAIELSRYVKQLGFHFDAIFEFCCDNDNKKWGKTMCGLSIVSLQEIEKYQENPIVIASIYEKEIRKQLLQMGIVNRIIGDANAFKRRLFIDHQLLHLSSNEKIKKRIEIEKITIYTALFGKYDNLQEPEWINCNVRYICFTDDEDIKSDNWEIVYVKRKYESPIDETRWYKMHSHEIIEDEWSMWIDANIQLVEDFIPYICRNIEEKDIMLFPHPERDCVYEEAAYCITIHKDNTFSLIKQMNAYYAEGCPEHIGLFLGGIIVRRNNSEIVRKFNELWWKEYTLYSKRDQVSLAYLIWKNDIKIALADIDVYNNSILVIHEHLTGFN